MKGLGLKSQTPQKKKVSLLEEKKLFLFNCHFSKFNAILNIVLPILSLIIYRGERNIRNEILNE